MPVWQKLLLLALAGGIGALARYGLAGVVQKYAGPAFPWGTLVVNLAGCFVFGVIWALAVERMGMSAEVRTILLVGFLGSLTTFSTFVSESYQLLAEAQWLPALGNLVGMNVSGLLVFGVGLAVGRIV